MEALALVELLTDKGLLEYAHATPELKRAFAKFAILEAASTTRWQQNQKGTLRKP